MKRFKMNKSQSKRNFRKGARTNGRNYSGVVRRGGIRL